MWEKTLAALTFGYSVFTFSKIFISVSTTPFLEYSVSSVNRHNFENLVPSQTFINYINSSYQTQV